MNENKDENLASYLKIQADDVKKYSLANLEKKTSGHNTEKPYDSCVDAKNCQRGTSNYSIKGGDGFLYCTLQGYCCKQATNETALKTQRAKRCTCKRE